MVYVIASSRHWNEQMPSRLAELTGHNFYYISNKADLTFEKIKVLAPECIFSPHWSYKIPALVYESFNCVVFHMTDLPYGRGGSPLQNLIARGIYETKISALKCVAEIDSGPVYLKKHLSLYGTAEEIYLRASRVIETMIAQIVLEEPEPKPQQGTIVSFQRRKPSDGDIAKLPDLEQVFDYIRMLDADGYPKAFLETDNLRLEFQRSVLKHGKIIADVIITKKE